MNDDDIGLALRQGVEPSYFAKVTSKDQRTYERMRKAVSNDVVWTSMTELGLPYTWGEKLVTAAVTKEKRDALENTLLSLILDIRMRAEEQAAVNKDLAKGSITQEMKLQANAKQLAKREVTWKDYHQSLTDSDLDGNCRHIEKDENGDSILRLPKNEGQQVVKYMPRAKSWDTKIGVAGLERPFSDWQRSDYDAVINNIDSIRAKLEAKRDGKQIPDDIDRVDVSKNQSFEDRRQALIEQIKAGSEQSHSENSDEGTFDDDEDPPEFEDEDSVI